MLTPLGRISYSVTATIISVDPSMLFAEPGEHFSINLTIANAVNVRSWQINMTFDSAVVSVVDITLPADNFLEGRPEGTTGLYMLIRESSVLFMNGILGDYDGMHGSGTLATVEFEVVATGESVLKIDPGEPGKTVLLDPNLIATYPGPNLTTEDGYISNIDHPPTASFTYSPSAPEINEIITFDASASSDPDGEIARYEWDFGDGTYTNETDPTTTHAYNETAIYTVTLTVIDNATATQKIKDTFGTTTIPRVWYELHSSYSAEVEFKVDHDIAVISVSASPATVTVGEPVTISVTVENQGRETETFSVIGYYDDTTAATTTVENLASEDEKTLELTWDTTDVTPKTYEIKAEANLEGDEDPDDNMLPDGTVTVKSSGSSIPIEYIAIGVVAGAAIVIGVFFFARRRTPAT